MSRGFTLFDIAFVLLLLTVAAMIAVPGALDRIRIVDEARAVTAVQWIAAAQAHLLASPAGTALDRDGDGRPEYGYLPDLLRSAPTDGPWGPPPFETDTDKDILSLPGFYVAILLPGPDGEPLLRSRGERVDPDFAEKIFAAVAWPMEAGRTGYRAYYVNHDLLTYDHVNEDGFLSGPGLPPLPSAVLCTRNPRTRTIQPPPVPAAPWRPFLRREQASLLEKRLGRVVSWR